MAIVSLSTDDLLEIAARADNDTLVVTAVALRDRADQPLDAHLEEEVVEFMVENLRAGDAVEAMSLLHGQRGPYTVQSVTFLGYHDDVTLHADGTIEGPDHNAGIEVAELVSAHVEGHRP